MLYIIIYPCVNKPYQKSKHYRLLSRCVSFFRESLVVVPLSIEADMVAKHWHCTQTNLQTRYKLKAAPSSLALASYVRIRCLLPDNSVIQ